MLDAIVQQATISEQSQSSLFFVGYCRQWLAAISAFFARY
ncbi:hypothetical protein O59_003127 [Cellvibrio sp. BR]|nr:hypothetical protein O59_003127 [Cellvibrio sp. BR]